ncbi:MAG: 16S rRNA (uracil(1498)-N(3))-methyltransferase [Planctomycetota bacterium]|nr:MAG: 16S rRNA (uracil(1498)-N(3))-methyltransferase [Planctomycetota bacterium]
MRTLFAPQPIQTGVLLLDAFEAHHGRTVLRLKAGDHCRVVDGGGRSASAVVCEVGRHSLHVQVEAVSQHPRPSAHCLTMALAAPKGNHLDDVVRSLVELGVGAITILECERSSRMPKVERLQRIAVEAVKQCGSTWLPSISIHGPLLAAPLPGRVMVLAPDGGTPVVGTPQDTTMVIGPEGGLTSDEQQHLVQSGAQACRLTDTILRIETAAIAAAAYWAIHWEHYD